jgi:hypothetical protein
MKLSKRLVSLTLLSAFLPCLTGASVAAAQSKSDASRRGEQASTRMSSKGAANTNSQWSADPEKGWVRADERHSGDKLKKNSGKHKGQNTRAGSTRSRKLTENGR